MAWGTDTNTAIRFCNKCFLYTSTRNVGLKKPCEGGPKCKKSMRELIKQRHPWTKEPLTRPYAIITHAQGGQGNDGTQGRHEPAAEEVSTSSAGVANNTSNEVCRPCISLWDDDAQWGFGEEGDEGAAEVGGPFNEPFPEHMHGFLGPE